MRRLTRRQFLGLGLVALAGGGRASTARFAEPTWLRVTHFDLHPQPTSRFVQFSDLHYKGDAEYARESRPRRSTGSHPDFVCFTGDLVEEARFAPAALDFIRQIKWPVYGCPGNWDYGSGADFEEYAEAFARPVANGWRTEAWCCPSIVSKSSGWDCGECTRLGEARAERRLLLIHYPTQADRLEGRRYDLILAGHSHGGQVRIPFYGAPVLPYGVGRYQRGSFESLGGPLYVNVGIGTYRFPIRFNCRPEITVLRM